MNQHFYYAKKGNSAGKRHYRQLLAEETPTYLLTDSYSTRLDDFLKRFPVATLNEYGERIIGGRRIC